jgi:hypothetical protein
MLGLLLAVLAAVRVFFRSRAQASLEVLALRQQVAMLKRQRPRPTLTRFDRVSGPPFGTCGPDGRTCC